MTLSNGKKVQEDQSVMHSILLGGDRMTAAWVRAAQDAKANGQTSYKRYEGVVPVFEDWHSKGNIMGVSTVYIIINHYSCCGSTIIRASQLLSMVQFTN